MATKKARNNSIQLKNINATVPRPHTSPHKKHHCTDIICTIILLIFTTGLVLLSLFAYINGRPSELILPHDSEGRICGQTEGVKNKPSLYFFDLTKCLSVLSAINGCPTKQICVKDCPNENLYDKIPGHRTKIKQFCDPFDDSKCPSYLVKSKPIFGRCVPEIVASLTNNTLDVLQAFDSDKNISIPIQSNDQNGETTDLTVGTLKEASNYLKNFLNLKKTFELALEDFLKSYWLILIALALTAIISFMWLLVLRFIIKPVIYFTIITVLALLGFLTYFSINEYLSLRNEPNSDFKLEFESLYDLDYLKGLKETWLVFSIVIGLIFIILFLIIIFLRTRIKLAAELIKEVSKAVFSIPSSLVWPLIPFLFEIGILVYCISISLYLASSGIQLFKIVDLGANSTLVNSTFKIGDYCLPEVFTELKDELNNPANDLYECYFYKYGFNTTLPIGIQSETLSKYFTKGMEVINEYQWIPQAYTVFMLFWLTAFMMGLNEMTIAGAFGAWYWSNKGKLPFFTLFGSLGRAVFYHFGTIAFGSLLIAIVKMIRIVLEFLSNKFKSKADGSRIARFFLCCLKFCFWCLERFIKFLNRYAFIITAAYSLNFCRAAAKAFKLITSNALRIVVIDKITNFVLFLSNLSITCGIGAVAFFFFTKKLPIEFLTKYSPDLNYYFLPLIVIVLGAYGVTKLFFDVFSIGIDSVLISVLIDLDENDGSKEKPYSMSKNLRKILKVR